MAFLLGRLAIFALRASPHEKGILAFGCKNGFVFVVDVEGKGKVLHKIHAHEEDIQVFLKIIIEEIFCSFKYKIK